MTTVDPQALSLESLAEAADRANRLQRVTGRLAGALTPQQVLDAILTEGLRAAEARAGAIGLLSEDGRSITLLAQSGYSGPVFEKYGQFSVEADLPMAYVARSGEPLFLESRAERNKLFPNLEGEGGDGNAIAVLPLGLDDRLLGVIALSFGENMRFSEERRQMKITLARQAAQALERARLYAAEQSARQRLAFIAEASEVLASSLDYEQTLRRVAQLAVPRLADWCAIDMVGANGEIERLAVAHEDPEKVKRAYELQERYPPDPDSAARGRPGDPLRSAGFPARAAGRAHRGGHRRRRGAPPDHRRARPALLDLRPAHRARPDAGRGLAHRRREASRVHAGRLRPRPRARPPRRGRGRQLAPLPGGREGGERSTRARVRRRRSRPARPGRLRPPLESGRRPDHRRVRGGRRWPPDRGCHSRLGPAQHACSARGARRRPRPAGDGAADDPGPGALALRLRRGLRRRDGLRPPRRDRRAGAREDPKRLRRDCISRAAHAARGHLRSSPHAPERGPRARGGRRVDFPRDHRGRVAPAGADRRPDPRRGADRRGRRGLRPRELRPRRARRRRDRVGRPFTCRTASRCA